MNEVFRYVITHEGKDGLRTLTFAQQGRCTYTDKEEAEKAMELFRPGLHRVIGDQIDTLKVLHVECWPGHFDPKGSIFED